MKAAKLLAFVAVLGMVSLAVAEDARKKERPKGISGKITSVDVEAKTVTIAKRTRDSKETTEVTVATNDDTVVTIDREKATLAELKKDMYVFITPETASKDVPATKISAMTKRPERKKPTPKPE